MIVFKCEKFDLRSTECVPAILLDETRTTKIDQDTFASGTKNNVLVFDVAMDCVIVSMSTPQTKSRITMALTDPARMEETQGVCDLTEVTPDATRRKTMGVAFNQIKKIGRRWWFVELLFCSRRWQDKIVKMVVLEEIKEWAYIRVTFHGFPFCPGIVAGGIGF